MKINCFQGCKWWWSELGPSKMQKPVSGSGNWLKTCIYFSSPISHRNDTKNISRVINPWYVTHTPFFPSLKKKNLLQESFMHISKELIMSSDTMGCRNPPSALYVLLGCVVSQICQLYIMRWLVLNRPSSGTSATTTAFFRKDCPQRFLVIAYSSRWMAGAPNPSTHCWETL